jgi:plastocyanin
MGGEMPQTARRTATYRLPTLALALIVPVVAAVVAVVTLAVTDDGTGAAARAAAGGASASAVTIENFEFVPGALRANAGATITVTNADGAAHTLTADDGSFDTGTLDGGRSATISVDAPGRYRYFCDIHNYMTGVIVAR